MAKKTFKKEQIIAAYNILKDAKLGKIDTVSDRLKVSDVLRVMRPIVKAHDEDMEAVRETLRPEALAELQCKIKEGTEVTQMDMTRATLLNGDYNEALVRYVAQRMAEEHEFDLVALSKECTERLIEGNPDWTPEQLMALMDVLG